MDYLKEQTGDACITNVRKMPEYTSGYVPLCKSNRTNDEYLKGKEYLTNMVMLSLSHCLLASRTSGLVGVMLMNDQYEDTYFLI